MLSAFNGACRISEVKARNEWSYMASAVISAVCGHGASAYRRVLARFIKHLVRSSRLCSLDGGTPFVHVLSICWPTGCYAVILIRTLVVCYPTQLKLAVVDVRVHSEIIDYRKMSF